MSGSTQRVTQSDILAAVEENNRALAALIQILAPKAATPAVAEPKAAKGKGKAAKATKASTERATNTSGLCQGCGKGGMISNTHCKACRTGKTPKAPKATVTPVATPAKAHKASPRMAEVAAARPRNAKGQFLPGAVAKVDTQAPAKGKGKKAKAPKAQATFVMLDNGHLVPEKYAGLVGLFTEAEVVLMAQGAGVDTNTGRVNA